MSDDQPRKTKGTPAGGEFDHKRHGSVDLDLDGPVEPPVVDQPEPPNPFLTDYKVVGFVRKSINLGDGHSAPGGQCANCGMALVNCVQAQHKVTGKIEDIGMDCAERIGMDAKMVKEYWRAANAERHEAARAIEREKRQQERDENERAITARAGEHGTESRYLFGCRCEECCLEAPHGTVESFRYNECRAKCCIDAMIEVGICHISPSKVLVDYETGQIVPGARAVQTRYGMSWVIDGDDNGGEPTWVSMSPKRRATMTKKGYLEAEVPTLWHKASRHSDRKWWPMMAMEQPTVDTWGEPIPQAADHR